MNSNKSPSNPDFADIIARRTALGLSRAEAAAVIHKSARTWEKWEQGGAKMDPAFWELFVLKTGGSELT